jgi:hypothetical protein
MAISDHETIEKGMTKEAHKTTKETTTPQSIHINLFVPKWLARPRGGCTRSLTIRITKHSNTSLCDGSGAERHDLFVEELFQLFSTDIIFVNWNGECESQLRVLGTQAKLTIELEEFRVKGRCDGLIIRIVLEGG